MFKFRISILFFAFLFLTQPCLAEITEDTQKFKESEKYFDEGIDFYEMKQFERAVESFKKAIEIRPDYANAYYWLGDMYERLGEQAKKVEAFKKAIGLFKEDIKRQLLKTSDSENVIAYHYIFLAYSYYKLDEYDKAIEAYKEAIRLEPNNPHNSLAYGYLGIIYDKLNQNEKAVGAFEEAIKLEPNNPSHYRLLGHSYDKFSQYEKAAEVFKEAIRLEPNDPSDYRILGIIYDKLNQNEKAVGAFKEAIKLEPNNASNYGFLGLSYDKLNQNEKAIEAYKEAIRLEPNNALNYSSLRRIYSKLKQDEKAVEAYKEVIRLEPNDPSNYRLLGLIYNNLKQSEKAIEAYKEAIRLEPNNPSDYRTLGHIYDNLNQSEKAIEAYKEAIRLEPNNPSGYRFLGLSYSKLNQDEKAIEAYKEVIRLEPNNPSLYRFIGTLHSKLNQDEKAIEAYKEAIRLEPSNPSVHLSLGLSYNALNEYEKAIEVYKKAIKLKPDFADAYESIGNSYLMLGNLDEAVNSLKVALVLFKKISDREEEANILTQLSMISLLQYKDIDLFHDLENALGIYEDFGNSIFKGTALSLIARMYSEMGKNKQALVYYRKALDIYEKLGDDVYRADILIDIAENSINFEEMLKYGTQALERINQFELTSNRKLPLIHKAYKTITLAYVNSKDYNNATVYAESMVRISQEMRDKGFASRFVNDRIALSNLILGRIMVLRGYYQEGLNYLQKTVNVVDASNPVNFKWLILWQLGKINDYLGNFAVARSQYFSSVNSIETLRASAQSLAFKIFIGGVATDVYTDTILFLLKTNEQDEAFNLMERAKARVFLDLLGGKLKLQNKEVIEEERRLQFRINYLSEKIGQADKKSNKEDSLQMRLSLEKQLNNARGEYTALIEKIKKESPELSTLLTVNPLNLKEVQNLLDPDITLLEYFITPDKTLLWVVDRQDLKVISIDIKSDDLASKVEAYREKISKLEPDYKKDADDLYGLLIKPAKPYIKTRRIGIVPHSVLHYLPFHALLNEDRFLIEEYDMFYAPSASVLKFVYEKRKELKGRVLAFGNPKLDDEKLDLPYAEEEVRKIKIAYPDTALYLRENATEDKAKKLSGGYNIIHFASHGELNPTVPMFSSIRLAKDKEEDGKLEVNEIFNLDLKNTALVILSACETGLGKLSQGDEIEGLTRGFIYAGTPSIVASLWRVNDQSTSELMSLFYQNLKNHPKSEALRMAQLEMIKGKTGKGIVRGVGGITASKKARPEPRASETVDGSHPYFWAPFILLGDWK